MLLDGLRETHLRESLVEPLGFGDERSKQRRIENRLHFALLALPIFRRPSNVRRPNVLSSGVVLFVRIDEFVALRNVVGRVDELGEIAAKAFVHPSHHGPEVVNYFGEFGQDDAVGEPKGAGVEVDVLLRGPLRRSVSSADRERWPRAARGSEREWEEIAGDRAESARASGYDERLRRF